MLVLDHLINRRRIIEQNEAKSTRSAGVRICLDSIVLNGAKLFEVCLEILCIHKRTTFQQAYATYTAPSFTILSSYTTAA